MLDSDNLLRDACKRDKLVDCRRLGKMRLARKTRMALAAGARFKINEGHTT